MRITRFWQCRHLVWKRGIQWRNVGLSSILVKSVSTFLFILFCYSHRLYFMCMVNFGNFRLLCRRHIPVLVYVLNGLNSVNWQRNGWEMQTCLADSLGTPLRYCHLACLYFSITSAIEKFKNLLQFDSKNEDLSTWLLITEIHRDKHHFTCVFLFFSLWLWCRVYEWSVSRL